MEAGQLLERMFELPFQFKASDLLFHDELAYHHAHLLENGANARRTDCPGHGDLQSEEQGKRVLIEPF